MNKYEVIGVMSGTSLDGLDIVCVQFEVNEGWTYEILKSKAIVYDNNMFKRIQNASSLSGIELKKLDLDLGIWIGSQVKQFITNYRLNPVLIASHGHTIFHQPEIGLTLQIGDGYEILKSTGIKTICDFRSLDVSLGGQGAPLVPIGDKLLFSEYDFCLNLGGFSNISYDLGSERIAYDICPVNTVLNYLSNQVNEAYDKNGELAKAGKLDGELLHKLNGFEYFNANPPKSLGIEWVQKHVFPMLHQGSNNDLLNTYCHHIAYQIARPITKVAREKKSHKKAKVLVTGGGAKNNFLMDLIKEAGDNQFEIVIPDDSIIDFKEAIIFAFLGLLRYLGNDNTLKSVTGATKDSSGGLIYG